MFQQYKCEHSKEVPVEYVDSLNSDFEINGFIFTPPNRKKMYDRKKKKKEDKEIIREWEEEK